MSDEKKQLVVLISCGLENEKMSAAWSITDGAVNNGLDVTVFLTCSAIDCVRKGAAERVRLNPLDATVGEMIESVTSRGGRIFVCPPCAEVRGYTQEDLLPGVVIRGSVAMHERIKEGAATLCF